MKKKELLKRIQELEQISREKDEVIIKLMKQISDNNQQIFYADNSNICVDGKDHDYPSPWHSITPPHCKKCGKQDNSIDVSFNTSSPVIQYPITTSNFSTTN